MTTTIDEIRGQILRDTFGRSLSDSDAFLLFVLLHHYEIKICGNVLRDRPTLGAGSWLAPDTQRGCGAALASIWAGTGDARSDYLYWYSRWGGEWGSYEHADNLTLQESARLRELISRLQEHIFVSRLRPEGGE